MSEFDKYINGIEKTGFIFEYEIVSILKKAGWLVVNNKFYEDDVELKVRELDILAYKSTLVDDIYIYTALLISCKTSADLVWSMLARDINLSDVNHNWWPNFLFSNVLSINYQINSEGMDKEYFKFVSETKNIPVMKEPEVDIFAFQELDKASGNPKNNSNIFSSITALMKAQSYEIDALPSRVKKNCIYQFNLVTVINTDLLRILINKDVKTVTKVESELLVLRYIVKKQEQFFRIRIFGENQFSKYISQYNDLHEANLEYFQMQKVKFFEDALANRDKNRVISEFFFNDLRSLIDSSSTFDIQKLKFDEDPYIVEFFHADGIFIFIWEDHEANEKLNNDEFIKTKVSDLIYKHFRIRKNFYFTDDSIPF